MRNENWSPFHTHGRRIEGGIRTAVEAWCQDPAAAKLQYGPIASWDTSEIFAMDRLFEGLRKK